jgi:hypothetical protein
MKNKPEDFKVYHHAIPEKESCYSWTSVGVLPELIGKPWNEITMCYVLSLEPKAIRVSTGMVTLDSRTGRITVIVNDSNIIQEISKEVQIPVPDDMFGSDLRQALTKL